jgi:hypothetical protein
MKTALIAAAASIIFAAPVLAVDAPQSAKTPGPNFEQHKADIVRKIDARIAYRQEEKACVQAAKNHDDLKACRDRFKAEVQELKMQKK